MIYTQIISKYPAAFVVAFALLGTARAQTANDPAPGKDTVLLSAFEVSSTSDTGYRATNTVSGSRINLKLIDMPQTISVITSDFIKDLGAVDLDDALIYASGVSTNGFFTGQYSIRGFSTGAPRRNGVSFASNNAIDSSVVDRVEVVKGPSSALYGTGGPGGVVNILTKQPQAKRATALETSVTSEGSLLGQIDTTGPLTRDDTLLYRFIVVAQDQKSSRDFGKRESWHFAPSLRWNLRGAPHTTSLTLSSEWLHVPHMNSSDERFPQVVETRPAPIGGNPTRMIDIGIGYAPGLSRDFSITGPNAARMDDEQYFEANFVHTFSDQLSARVIFSQSFTQQERFTQFANGALKRNAAGVLPVTVPIQSWHSDTDAWNRTIRADINYAQTLSWAKFNFVLGAEDTASAVDRSIFRNLGRPDFHLYAPTAADYDLGKFPSEYNHLVEDRNASNGRQISGVANAVLFGGKLNVIGAANRSFVRSGILILPDLRASGGQAPSVQVSPAAHFDSYQAGFSYRVAADVNLFYSYSESIQSNGTQFPNDPQEGKGQEAGVRFGLLGGRLSGSLSFFNVERTNIPRRDPNLPGGVTRLSGKERSRGYEFDLFWFPTDALQFVANYTDMDPTVVSNTAAPVTEGSLIDSAFPRALNVFGKYTFKRGATAGLYVTLGANFRSVSRPYGTLENLYLLEHPAYTLVNGSIGYAWKRGAIRWTADLALRNAGDTFYYTDTSIAGERRAAVFTLGMKF